MRYMSIDLETTDLDVDLGSVSEVALVDVESGESIRLHLRPNPTALWSAFSLAKTAAGREVTDAKSMEAADSILSTWLWNMGCVPDEVMAMGWNVGSFDRVFIRRELPRLNAWLNYRHIDLTGMRTSLDLIDYPTNCDHLSGEICEDWVKHVKRIAVDELFDDDLHNALWDAKAAIVFWNEYLNILRLTKDE